MPRWIVSVPVAVAAACAAVSAYADACPYCGRPYPPAAPGDEDRVNLLRRQHEATCPARNKGGGAPGLSAEDQMALGIMGLGAQWAGEELHKALWGDPEEEARQAEEARARAAEQVRLELEHQAAEARRREELHQKLLRALKLTGAGEVGLKGFDGDGQGGMKLKLSGDDAPDDGLRPQGTSFFGLGGGAGDPMVVDLRDLRRGAYLVRQAADAPPEDAAILMDDALKAAAGGGAPPIPLDDCPKVSDEGLLAFQKANRDYRLARESGRLAEERHRNALKDVDAAHREAALLRDARDPDGAKKAAFLKALDRLRETREAEARERARLEAGRSRTAFEDWFRRLTLRQTVKPDPSAATTADTLRQERERLQPDLAQRARHFMAREHALAGEGLVLDSLRRDYQPPAPEIDKLRPQVQRLVDRLVAVSPYPDERIEAVLAGMPVNPVKESGWEDNAGGLATHLVVGEKFLRDWQARGADESELAFVLGHEVTHVQSDHFDQRLNRKLEHGFPEALQYPDFSDTAFQLMPEPQQREVLDRFRAQQDVRKAWWEFHFHDANQAMESQADRGAMALILPAGFNPAGVRRSMAACAAEDARRPPEPAAARAFRDQTAEHPSMQARFADLRNIWGRMLGDPLP